MIISNVIYTDTYKAPFFAVILTNGRFDDNSDDDVKYCRLWILYLLVFSHEMTHPQVYMEGCSCYSGCAFLSIINLQINDHVSVL